MLHLTLRLLHIIFMAAWIAGASFIFSDVKRTLMTEGANLELLANRVKRYGRVSTVSGWLTLITGFALVFELGGFAAVPRAIHFAIVSTILTLVVGGALISRNANKVVAGLKAGEAASSLLPHTKKIGMGVGMFHTLWMVTLAFMVFRAVI